ncbi:MAG: hypothetical protein NWE88_01855 [Candidatus Bathyarchaeota archaeon]|nr:hypothetical protein [Candidatus Bathyarchaeota archaeon]
MKITYEEWMSPQDLDSGVHLDCDDDPPCPLRIEGQCAILSTSDDVSLDNFREACHKIALLRESSGFRLRTPPPENRKRGARKGGHIEGDYRTDVDEGIANEVRIFNEELGLETWSSCEGHLSESRDDVAYVNCYIDDKFQKEIIKLHRAVEVKTIVEQERRIIFQLDSEACLLSLIIDPALKRNNKPAFSIIVEPKNPDIPWYIWDRVRENGFKQAIDILEKIKL